MHSLWAPDILRSVSEASFYYISDHKRGSANAVVVHYAGEALYRGVGPPGRGVDLRSIRVAYQRRRLSSMARDLIWLAGGLGLGWALIFTYLFRLSRKILVLTERVVRLREIVNARA
jgi:hypothetical protein